MSHPPRAWVAWSTGKDSLWALHIARQTNLEVVGLLVTITEPFSRVSMHGVRECLAQSQAEALGLPLHRVPIPYPCSQEEYEARMAEATARAVSQGVSVIVFGDIHLAEVRAYREKQLAGTGLTPAFPLWGSDPGALAREMIRMGVRAHVTCLDPRRIDPALAGQPYDLEFLARLPAEVDPLGEHGEFHTFAWDGPGFSRPVAVSVGEVVERDGFVFADLQPVATAARGGTLPGSCASGWRQCAGRPGPADEPPARKF